MRAGLLAVVALAGLAGCADPTAPITTDMLDYERGVLRVERFVQDTPFDSGPVSVVMTERGRLETYTLVPCRGGTHICGGDHNGPAGHLRRGLTADIVTGAYPGRTFHLSPGGDGIIELGGRAAPLAWN